MTDVASLRPLLAVLVSALAIPVILSLDDRPNVREAVTLAVAGTKFAIVASMVPGVLAGTTYVTEVVDLGNGLAIELQADPLGILFGLLASLLWIVTSFYSIGYMRGLSEHAQTRYFASFAASLASAIGVAFGANLLTLFVFDLSAGHPRRDGYRAGRWPEIPHLHLRRRRRGAWRHRPRVLPHRNHGVHAGRYRGAGDCGPDAGPGRLRPACGRLRGESGADAGPLVAARRDGRADACFGSAPRRRRRQERHLRPRAHRAGRLWHRDDGPVGCRAPACRRRRVHAVDGECHRATEGQPQAPAGLLHHQPTLLHRVGTRPGTSSSGL